jgi:hypothetical protein
VLSQEFGVVVFGGVLFARRSSSVLPPFRVLLHSYLKKRNETETEKRTFSVPINIKCSQKCANPGMSSGSLKCPTLTSIAAAALSVLGSETRETSRPFSRMIRL